MPFNDNTVEPDEDFIRRMNQRPSNPNMPYMNRENNMWEKSNENMRNNPNNMWGQPNDGMWANPNNRWMQPNDGMWRNPNNRWVQPNESVWENPNAMWGNNGQWNQFTMNPYMPMPSQMYENTFTQSELDEAEEKAQKDLEYLMEMYPATVRKLQKIVQDECDDLDYEASIMYDEYPDRAMLRSICKKIRETYEQTQDNQVMTNESCTCEKNTLEDEELKKADVWMKKNNTGIDDLIEVLFFNELHRRRCRHNRCTKRKYHPWFGMKK